MSETKACPFCDEEIRVAAVKCKHCGEFLDGQSSRPGGDADMPAEIGSYRILDLLGEGGMGAVYRGKHRSASMAARQGGEVCIKKMHLHIARDETYRARFEHEAELGLKLSHLGIVTVHDLVTDGGALALVMELVQGRSLARLIGRETGAIPWDRAWPMFSQLLDAVEHAHGQGIIHRDIKPDNVMITEDGRLKVLDFGIAKGAGSGNTRTGAGMGSVDYMAPEQHTDARNVDVRADVFSLGMTLYEMLAGRLPWGEELDLAGVLLCKQGGEIPPPTAFYPGIPPAVVEVVMSALAPDREVRPASVGILRQALADAARRPKSITPEAVTPTVTEAPVWAQHAEARAAHHGVARGATVPEAVPVPGMRSPLRPWMVAAGLGVVVVLVVFATQLGKSPSPQDPPPQPDDPVSEAPQAKAPPPAAEDARVDVKKQPTTSPGKAGMVWVRIPGGSFMMGSTSEDDAEPVHRVTLGSFEMTRTEVTVAQYRACVTAGKCTKPGTGRYCNWGKRGRDAHPVNCVDWSQARAFCGWAGGRLPSEARWEYAARSGGKSWTYPWGNAAPTCSRAVMGHGRKWCNAEDPCGCGKNSTWPVCSRSAGNTAQGLCDMAGNVWEWTEDCWHDSYSGAPTDGSARTRNCSDSYRVDRGGSWLYSGGSLRAARRSNCSSDGRLASLGLRCAR